MPEEDTPELTVIAHRPVKVLHRLKSSGGVLVQCRLASGEDTFVPLAELMRLFYEDMAARVRAQMEGRP